MSEAPANPPNGTTHVYRDMTDEEIADVLNRAQTQFFHAQTYIRHGFYKPGQWGKLADTCQQLGVIQGAIRQRSESVTRQWTRP